MKFELGQAMMTAGVLEFIKAQGISRDEIVDLLVGMFPEEY
ncbi:hypothetical protein [Virgibacillus salidurans]|nr:hypothetical protein [Virgibacillus sp. NKC19-16]